jgi:hypothetical protein
MDSMGPGPAPRAFIGSVLIRLVRISRRPTIVVP